MSRLLLAFSSFIMGICCSALVLQLPRVQAGQVFVNMPNAIPQVPPIQFHGDGSDFSGGPGSIQQLDGFECSRCILNISLFTYGGGSVNLSKCKISPKSVIELKGAALNTFNVLRSLGYITPKTQTATLEIKSPDAFTLRALDTAK